MRQVEGVVKRYDWGSEDVIPQILGRQGDGTPWAEYWLGAHPSGAALLTGSADSLAEVSRADPGWSDGPWPHLFKLLSAERPLSIQVHPDGAQAAAGWALQGGQGGRFADAFGKPELIVALRPTRLLAGWARDRQVDAMEDLLNDVPAPAPTRGSSPTSSRAASWAVALLSDDDLARLAVRRLEKALDDGTLPPGLGPLADDLRRVRQQWPGDRGLALCTLLDLHCLDPGESVFIPPTVLHAYLAGAGVEVMGPSDNVFRAGLTTKEVDTSSVLAVMDVAGRHRPRRLRPRQVDLEARCIQWEPPGVPWALAVHSIDGPAVLAPGPSIVFCESGFVSVHDTRGRVTLAPGQAAAGRLDASDRRAAGCGRLWELHNR